MTMMNRVTTMARGAAIGGLAMVAAMLMLPAAAVAAPGPHQIAERLDRIAYRVESIPDIDGLYRKDAAIGRLQSRLYRLERITEYQRGRRARRNGHIIDRLQHRLRRMEHRVAARIARREARRDYRRDYRTGYRGTGSLVVISRGYR